MGDLPPMDCIEVSSFAPPDDYGLDDADALRARSTRRGRSSRSDGTGPDRRSTTAGSDAADPLRDLKEHADLTQSVAWLSKHVPECVLRSLFDGIERARADDAPLAEEPAPAGRAPPASGAEDAPKTLASRNLTLDAMEGVTGNQHQPPAAKNSRAVRGRTFVKSLFKSIARKGHRVGRRGKNDRRSGEEPRKDMADSEPGNSSEDNVCSSLASSTAMQSSDPDSPTASRGSRVALPLYDKHESAVLFVDISGFTKMSQMLDVESLSNAINSYFQMIINEVANLGGDVIKFAGDAIFVEWKVGDPRPHCRRHRNDTLEGCVLLAARCGAAIVAHCSDHAVASKPQASRRTFMRSDAITNQSSRRMSVGMASEDRTVSSAPSRNRRCSLQISSGAPARTSDASVCSAGAAARGRPARRGTLQTSNVGATALLAKGDGQTEDEAASSLRGSLPSERRGEGPLLPLSGVGDEEPLDLLPLGSSPPNVQLEALHDFTPDKVCRRSCSGATASTAFTLSQLSSDSAGGSSPMELLSRGTDSIGGTNHSLDCDVRAALLSESRLPASQSRRATVDTSVARSHQTLVDLPSAGVCSLESLGADSIGGTSHSLDHEASQLRQSSRSPAEPHFGSDSLRGTSHSLDCEAPRFRLASLSESSPPEARSPWASADASTSRSRRSLAKVLIGGTDSSESKGPDLLGGTSHSLDHEASRLRPSSPNHAKRHFHGSDVIGGTSYSLDCETPRFRPASFYESSSPAPRLRRAMTDTSTARSCRAPIEGTSAFDSRGADSIGGTSHSLDHEVSQLRLASLPKFCPPIVLSRQPQANTTTAHSNCPSADVTVPTSMVQSRRASLELPASVDSSTTHSRRASLGSPAIDAFRPRRRPSGASGSKSSLDKRLGLLMGAKRPTLNCKCGVAAGHIVGIHVGDDALRREYLIMGDPIDQVARAEGEASLGEVYASPEAVRCLARIGVTVRRAADGQETAEEGKPVRIADHDTAFFDVKARQEGAEAHVRKAGGNSTLDYNDLDNPELHWLQKRISLYVHPVVGNDDSEISSSVRGRRSDRDRHLVEAELRNVYTCFITPLIDCRLTGEEGKDRKIFALLNQIMVVTTRELEKTRGHLRQYILDDKGLVLICNWGLRGSTFPNMIAQCAVPFSLSIHKALEKELGVKSKIGATFGKVYCGIVGGLERHEFAVLGPSVNLAARLMASKNNPGLLVDKNVRLPMRQVYFKPLQFIKAKGYDEPVPTFEPMKNADDDRPKKKIIVGRAEEINRITSVAKDVVSGNASNLVLVSGVSGTGKSTLLFQSVEHVRSMMKTMNNHVIVTRNISRERHSRIPFSLFRSIYRALLSHLLDHDEEPKAPRSPGSTRRKSGHVSSDASSLGSNLSGPLGFDSNDPLDKSIRTMSTKVSAMHTDETRFEVVCDKLNAPPEIVEFIGNRLLGLRKRNAKSITANPPDLEKVVEFIANAFIQCTKEATLVLLALNNVQWMDEMSLKVVAAILEQGTNILVLCGSGVPLTNPLSLDPKRWSDLQDGRYFELELGPFNEGEVKELIASTLYVDLNEIDGSFSRSVMSTSGGMPHHVSCVLDTIKRNQLTIRLENGLIGVASKADKITADDDDDDSHNLEFGSVNEMLLCRLDSLDASVRAVLHISAVLGMEFCTVDVSSTYEEMYDIEEPDQFKLVKKLSLPFDVLVDEGILEQYYASEGEGGENFEEHKEKTHPFFTRRYRFTHDSWRMNILNVMLDERVKEMHEYIAVSMEKDLDDKDFEKQIRVVSHWILSSNFVKAATLGLKVGGQLMLLGLNQQAILLFDDVLDILIELTDADLDVTDEETRIFHGGISESVLNAIEAPELESLVKLNIAKGKAYSTLRLSGVDGAEAYQCALDILHNTPCAADEDFDRSVSFPIFSGLFACHKMGATPVEQGEECSYEKRLCKDFVEQARLNGDPVHYGRAMAMEAETLGRLGNFEEALDVVEQIKYIYNIEEHHVAICKAYGSDRVAQAFSHSVNFNNALGRTSAALDACNFVVEQIIPKSNRENIHNMYCLCFAIAIFLNENGLAMEAYDIFKTNVVDAFDKYFGQEGSTYSKPMFRPILTLLDLKGKENQDVEKIDEYMAWSLNEVNIDEKLPYEMTWASFSASPKAILGEIFFSLAKRREGINSRSRLIEGATSLMLQSIENTQDLPYANMHAKRKLDAIKEFAIKNGC